MCKNDNIPVKTWFSFNDIQSEVKNYGAELTVKVILEQAVLYTTKISDSPMSSEFSDERHMSFDSPERIQLFLLLEDCISAAVKHDVDGEEKHLGSISIAGLMPVSEEYVQEFLNLGSTNIQSFTFAKTGTGINKETWPKFHSNEPLEIGYADYCVFGREHAPTLTIDSIGKLYVHRSDAKKLFKKYQDMAKNSGFQRIHPGIESITSANLAPLTIIEDVTATDTVNELVGPSNASGRVESSEIIHQAQVHASFSDDPPEDYGELKGWLWGTWIKLERPSAKIFFRKLGHYVAVEGSPITKYFSTLSRSDETGHTLCPRIEYRLSTFHEGKLCKHTIESYISAFKKVYRTRQFQK